MPSYTYRDGQLVEIPDTVITEDTDLRESVTNTVIVRGPATATAYAPLSGTVTVESGATLITHGAVNGTVNVSNEGTVIFHGPANGTLHIGAGGLVHIQRGASAIGTMQIEGVLINDGVRGANIRGDGLVEDRPGSQVRQPDRTLPDGTTIYTN
jgi:hypothetical protein